MEIISRQAAKKRGFTRYFTGKACRSGGHVCERYVLGGCVECSFERAQSWNKENPDWRAAQNGKSFAVKRAPDCVPPDFDIKTTIEYYAESRRLTEATGAVYEVDHITPLKEGGLHTHWNLQVLKQDENLAKRRWRRGSG